MSFKTRCLGIGFVCVGFVFILLTIDAWPQAKFTLGGRIYNDCGTGFTGIIVYLKQNARVIDNQATNGSGYFNFRNVPKGMYIIEPASKPDYDFSPKSKEVNISGSGSGGVGGQDFKIIPRKKYSISGTIRLDNKALAGVKIEFSGCKNQLHTTTNGSGYYEFPGLIDATYRIIPSLSPYIFYPASQDVSIWGENRPGINFSATKPVEQYLISGYIRNQSGKAQSGIHVKITGHLETEAITNNQGYFNIKLTPGGYDLKPISGSKLFDPSSKRITVVDKPIDNNNFTLKEK